MNPAEFLSTQGRFLAMLNYEVDPSILRSLVPRGTELDAWESALVAEGSGIVVREGLRIC